MKIYEKIINIIARLFGLKIELVTLRKPLGAEYWAYSDKSNIVYQLYVTNYKDKKNENGSFGFWVYDETLRGVYKKAYKEAMPMLKYSLKSKIIND